jgi:hypothetical protein
MGRPGAHCPWCRKRTLTKVDDRFIPQGLILYWYTVESFRNAVCCLDSLFKEIWRKAELKKTGDIYVTPWNFNVMVVFWTCPVS